MEDKFLLNGPIPGMSLTGEPGNNPWEQPPKFSEMTDVVDYYSDALVTTNSITTISNALSNNISVISLAETMMLSGVMKGIHSIDLGTMVVPVLVELIKTIGDISDVKYVMDDEDIIDTTMIDEETMRKVIAEGVAKIKEEVPAKKGLMSKGDQL
jgi:hypothetical protein